jgi:hypothetical protein
MGVRCHQPKCAKRHFWGAHAARVLVSASSPKRGLTVAGLIGAPTLEEFRAAGFLFDHGIRCYMSFKLLETHRRSADRPLPGLPGNVEHLRPLLAEAQSVWVMGRIARKAVGSVAEDFPIERNQISKPSYPCRLRGTKYFVSCYLSRMSRNHAATICCALRDAFPEFFSPSNAV